MAERLTFTSVELDKLGRDKKGAWGTFSASLNAAVINKMGWSDIPEFMTGADLEGEIAAISMVIRPDVGADIDVELGRLTRFETVRRELPKKQGKGHRTELHFKLIAQDMNGASKLEGLMMSNPGKCKIEVSYEKQAKQEDLPGAERDTGCIQCNNGIEFDEDNPKMHASGKKCTARPVQEEIAN